MTDLGLIDFVTDSFATFGYNGIVRTKDVTPYSFPKTFAGTVAMHCV